MSVDCKAFKLFNSDFFECIFYSDRINPLSITQQNGQTHSNNSSAVANKLFECV